MSVLPLSLDELVEIISSETGLSKPEIMKLIIDKKKKMGNLINDVSAALLIAKDFGIDVLNKITVLKGKIDIQNLSPGMKNVTIIGRVLKIIRGPRPPFIVLVGDETGIIKTKIWDEQVIVTGKEKRDIKVGDILRILKADVKSDSSGSPEIHVFKKSKVMVNPPDIDPSMIPEVDLFFRPIRSLMNKRGKVLIRGVLKEKHLPVVYGGSGGEGQRRYSRIILTDGTGNAKVHLYGPVADLSIYAKVGDIIEIYGADMKSNVTDSVELSISDPKFIDIYEILPSYNAIIGIIINVKTENNYCICSHCNAVITFLEGEIIEKCPHCGRRPDVFDSKVLKMVLDSDIALYEVYSTEYALSFGKSHSTQEIENIISSLTGTYVKCRYKIVPLILSNEKREYITYATMVEELDPEEYSRILLKEIEALESGVIKKKTFILAEDHGIYKDM